MVPVPGWALIAFGMVALMLFFGGGAGTAMGAAAGNPGAGDAVHGQGATNAAVRNVGPGRFEMGRIWMDQAARTLTFPAAINLREGMVEYVLVADHGKIHESLLRTDVSPTQLQVAMLLLGAGPMATNPPAGPEAGWRWGVEVEWKERGRWTGRTKIRRRPVGEFIRDRRGRTTVGKGLWYYTGSRMREDGFAAERDGSIVSLIDDPDALLGSAWRGHDDDDNWLAVGRALPPTDTVVDVILTLPKP